MSSAYHQIYSYEINVVLVQINVKEKCVKEGVNYFPLVFPLWVMSRAVGILGFLHQSLGKIPRLDPLSPS